MKRIAQCHLHHKTDGVFDRNNNKSLRMYQFCIDGKKYKSVALRPEKEVTPRPLK